MKPKLKSSTAVIVMYLRLDIIHFNPPVEKSQLLVVFLLSLTAFEECKHKPFAFRARITFTSYVG